jgi:phytoene dehydrogenase-like protein
VLLEAYPECRRVLDYGRLRLRPFAAGSLVRFGGRFYRLADPWRRPLSALSGLLSPIGTFADKLRVGRLRRRLLAPGLGDIFSRPETTTLEALERIGFSTVMIERFFRPFLGGVFLDRDLATSSRMFEFVFKMFSSGSASLPAEGMRAIPDQLAAFLDPQSIRCGARVEALTDHGVRLRGGETLACDITVLATDARNAAALVPDLPTAEFRQTTCLYFDAPQAPVPGPWLVLNGDGAGPINNLCVPSEVAPTYAPPERALVSVTVVGDEHGEGAVLAEAVRAQLRQWFGPEVERWRPLRSYPIRHALPVQTPGVLQPAERPVQLTPSRFICGDHRDQGSIQGALTSGRRAAEAILARLH